MPKISLLLPKECMFTVHGFRVAIYVQFAQVWLVLLMIGCTGLASVADDWLHRSG